MIGNTHLVAAANALAIEQESDLYLYSGEIKGPHDVMVTAQIRQNRQRENGILFLATYGGSADSAYRIARSFQRYYNKTVLIIPAVCKSAGTLIALGFDEIVMSDLSELGPLDVQITKPDELFEYQSGLAPVQALRSLRQEAFEAFEDYFLKLRSRSRYQITTKTSSEIAASLTTGLFSDIIAMIDPMKLGENSRAMNIASEYGFRLLDKRKNVKTADRNHPQLKAQLLNDLLNSYPSHEFIIDREEASSLFGNVREPTAKEVDLIKALWPMLVRPLQDSEPEPIIECLSPKASPKPPPREPGHDNSGKKNANGATAAKPHSGAADNQSGGTGESPPQIPAELPPAGNGKSAAS